MALETSTGWIPFLLMLPVFHPNGITSFSVRCDIDVTTTLGTPYGYTGFPSVIVAVILDLDSGPPWVLKLNAEGVLSDVKQEGWKN